MNVWYVSETAEVIGVTLVSFCVFVFLTIASHIKMECLKSKEGGMEKSRWWMDKKRGQANSLDGHERVRRLQSRQREKFATSRCVPRPR